MTAADARTLAWRLALGLAAIVAAYGAWRLRNAQVPWGPIVVTLVAWAVLYFAIYDWVAPCLASLPGSVDPGNDERSWVGMAAFVLAALAVEGVIYGTLTEPITTLGIVEDMSVARRRYEPLQWRVGLDAGHWFLIPYGQGVTVGKGRRVSYTHRDAWLGVRIVTGYDLGKRP